jgi:D-glycero-D-manno-heptose 1,7-bisphosphate phosphatase
LFIVITNQSGISKNIYTHNDVRLLHEIMKEKLQKHSIIIEDVYYCPHHNETGKCLCRKPGSLLFEKAIVRFNIDVNKSLMFGDKERDIIAAESVGIKSILVKPNQLLPLINME